MYDADAVLQALLDEWQRRYERNEAHLKALFRAGDTNHDGVMTFDEWKEVIKHANDQMTEREVGVPLTVTLEPETFKPSRTRSSSRRQISSNLRDGTVVLQVKGLIKHANDQMTKRTVGSLLRQEFVSSLLPWLSLQDGVKFFCK